MTWDPRETISKLRKDLQRLCKERAFIEGQLANVNMALNSLARGIQDKQEREEVLKEIEAARRKPAGLTECVSDFLRSTHDSMSANEVRTWLERQGFDLSEYSQPLATVSATLRRLASSGRVEATRQGRNVTYKWIGDR